MREVFSAAEVPMRRGSEWCTWVASLALGAMLSGCGAASGARLSNASFPEATAGEGAALFALGVAVKSSSDNRAVGQFLTFERSAPPQKTRFSVLDVKEQAVFLVSLPPGTYTTYFEVVGEARLADGQAGVKVPVEAPFATFEVRRGEIAVLGALTFSATVTRADIATKVELEPGMGGRALVRTALARAEAREHGWSDALEHLLASLTQ
jgi:hypothetical protein